MRRKSASKAQDEYTHLELRVESFETSAMANINHDAIEPQSAWRLDEEDPVYKFTSEVRISAVCEYPDKRAGEQFEVSLYGDDRPSHRLHDKLKDIRTKDEFGSPRYRKYRGREIPIFSSPDGLGMVNKVRGERAWTAWLSVTPAFADRCQAILASLPETFITLNERKVGRARWVWSLSLQSAEPSEE